MANNVTNVFPAISEGFMGKAVQLGFICFEVLNYHSQGNDANVPEGFDLKDGGGGTLCDACRRVRDCSARENDSLTVEHCDFAIGIYIHDCRVALDNLTRQHTLRQTVLQHSHDGATKWAGSISGRESFIHKPILEALCNRQVHALFLHALEHLVQHDVRNLLHLQLGQLPEHNNFIETVQKLGAEVLLELLVHQRLDAVV
mmetsp:Transcript_47391/g.90492  ORF Transcript_47391/g.90492 Transcript_47391/m.90492 type:complete len:201 (+) Transcript_47391:338-940(+)